MEQRLEFTLSFKSFYSGYQAYLVSVDGTIPVTIDSYSIDLETGSIVFSEDSTINGKIIVTTTTAVLSVVSEDVQ